MKGDPVIMTMSADRKGFSSRYAITLFFHRKPSSLIRLPFSLELSTGTTQIFSPVALPFAVITETSASMALGNSLNQYEARSAPTRLSGAKKYATISIFNLPAFTNPFKTFNQLSKNHFFIETVLNEFKCFLIHFPFTFIESHFKCSKRFN